MRRKSTPLVDASAQSITGAAIPGRAPSIKEVALRAQVGLGTVSRVINGGGSVSERTRIRVLAAIAELGYAPDIVAQSMRNNRTMTFACVVRDFTVPVLSQFVDAMQKEIDSAGFSLIVASSYHDVDREIELLKRLAQRRVDGVVIATSSETNSELSSILRSVKFPVVLMDREVPEDLDAVLVDHALGTRVALERLIELGHRRIGIISGAPGLHPTTSRMRAYKEALQEHGLKYDPDLVRTDSFEGEAGYKHACELLCRPSRPTAIIAAGSTFLPGVIKAARENLLTIPGDLSVVSGAASDVASMFEPPITTVSWHHDQLGMSAGRLLMERLDAPQRQPQRLIFPSEMQWGGSCAPPKCRSTRHQGKS